MDQGNEFQPTDAAHTPTAAFSERVDANPKFSNISHSLRASCRVGTKLRSPGGQQVAPSLARCIPSRMRTSSLQSRLQHNPFQRFALTQLRLSRKARLASTMNVLTRPNGLSKYEGPVHNMWAISSKKVQTLFPRVCNVTRSFVPDALFIP